MKTKSEAGALAQRKITAGDSITFIFCLKQLCQTFTIFAQN